MNTQTNTPASYQINQLSSMQALAGELSTFIKSQKLSKQISGKEYVFCEGWTYAGSALGILPAVVSCDRIPDAEAITYKACVELISITTGAVVGRAFAICSNQESSKKRYEEFAIASTAMTRATGKAYRLPLGWLMKAAGYESCNAEEMDFNSSEAQNQEPKQRPPVSKGQNVSNETDSDKRLASIAEKKDLIICLAHESVKKEDKEKMIRHINKLTSKRCQDAIWTLRQQARVYDNMHH